MPAAIEREAKFEGPISGVGVPDLAGLVAGAYEVVLPSVTLTATYYDTDDLRLLGRHVTLRHRHDAAGQGEWTLKVPELSGGLGLTRTELTWPDPAGRIPDDASALVAGLSLGGSLRPVAEIVTVRGRKQLRASAGQLLAEIDDDDVIGTDLDPTGDSSPAGPLAFREIEVEVKIDDRGDDLLDLATCRLLEGGYARSSDTSKLRRVLAGRLGPDVIRKGPGPGSTVEEVVVATIAASLDRLVAHDLAVRLDPTSRGVHQARVATRRLRSDLKTLGDLLDPSWVERTRATLKWVGDALGEVRDADVLARRLVDHRAEAAAADAEAFDGLDDVLSQQRGAAGVDLSDLLHRPRYIEVLGQLDRAVSSPPWRADAAARRRRPARKELCRLVRRPWRKLHRAVNALGEAPSDHDLHRARIKAKQLRYAAEMATPVIGHSADRLARSAQKVQNVLGDHNDAVDAEAWLRRAAAAKPSVALAAGQAIAGERGHRASTRQAWPEVWNRLSRTSRRGWMR